MWCGRWGERLSGWGNGIGRYLTAYNLEDLIRRELTVGAGKTREARWERRQGMRRRLLAAVANIVEGTERSRSLCAWDTQA